MTTMMLILYFGLAILLFRFKILKVRPFPIAWVALGGILIVGAVVIAWKQCSPMSNNVVTFKYVVQLVPYVKGQVLRIHAQPNQQTKKGDLLLEINPEPYQYSFNSAQAQFDASREGVQEAKAKLEMTKAGVTKGKAGVNQAVAAVNQTKAAVTSSKAALTQAKAAVANAEAAKAKAEAADALARTEEQIALDLRKTDSGAISTLSVARATQARKESAAALIQSEAGVSEARAAEQRAVAVVSQTQADEQQAEAALAAANAAVLQAEASERQAEFAVKVAESQVTLAQANLNDARFNLDQCRMYAPADGYVVDWTVREGQMVTETRMTPAGTFVCTAETYVIASFHQNYLSHVQPGDDVEFLLDPYPGYVFKGKVDFVIAATGEGQYDPNKTIPEASKVGSQGMLAVRIRFAEPVPHDLALGAGGEVAIYTDAFKPVNVFSKIFLRVKKWKAFAVPSTSAS
jgi:multidrug resistance efflux pump